MKQPKLKNVLQLNSPYHSCYQGYKSVGFFAVTNAVVKESLPVI